SIAPLIIINSNDAKPARLFTLIHELAHIWIGESGISNLSELTTNEGHNHIEKFCNAVAAEFLVPEAVLRAVWEESQIPQNSIEDMVNALDALARKFKVSGAVISRRLLDIGYIKRQTYESLFIFYQKRWDKFKDQLKPTKGGPNPNTLATFYLGKKTLDTFMQAINSGQLTLQDTARVLNIPVNRFDKVMPCRYFLRPLSRFQSSSGRTSQRRPAKLKAF
ncbi:MAG: ImmA/IrrE family metallo-endopeptidase, partial [Candidatus Adiutrix sp.]